MHLKLRVAINLNCVHVAVYGMGTEHAARSYSEDGMIHFNLCLNVQTKQSLGMNYFEGNENRRELNIHISKHPIPLKSVFERFLCIYTIPKFK